MSPDTDPTQAVDGLVGALKNLTTDPNYMMLTNFYDEAMTLREQNHQLSISHRQILEEYRAFRNELEAHQAQLVESKTSLQKLLEERDAKVAALDEANKTLETTVEDKEKTLSELQELKIKLEKDAEAAISQLEEEKKKIDAMASEAEGLKTTVAGLSTELARSKEEAKAFEDKERETSSRMQILQTTVDTIAKELQIKSEQLAKNEQYRVVLVDEPEDKYVSILDNIWTSVIHLVETHLKQDLDEKVLSDSSCWKSLQESPYLKGATQIPLPRSNSLAAKRMRVAAVLAVLSRALDRHIFRPIYLMDDADSVGAEVGLARLLREVEALDPEREVHCRATLLAALPEERQRASAKRRAQQAVRDVQWVVQHLLGALQYGAFCAALESVCTLACTKWMEIQKARMKIEPYFGQPYDDYDWQVLPLLEGESEGATGSAGALTPPRSNAPSAHGSPHQGPQVMANEPDPSDAPAVSTAEDSAVIEDDESDAEIEPDNILLVVWPTMCAVEEGDLSSITQGLVISKEQARDAQSEVKTRQVPRPAQKRARTMSVPGHVAGVSAGKAFLGAGEGASKDG